MKACACVVLVFLTALLFCPMTSAAEAPNAETEQGENQQFQGLEERKENEETREDKKGEEEESTEGIRILSGLPPPTPFCYRSLPPENISETVGMNETF